jgi:hypothetical protein
MESLPVPRHTRYSETFAVVLVESGNHGFSGPDGNFIDGLGIAVFVFPTSN